MQKAYMEKMMRTGGTDPWAVDFQEQLAGKDLTDPTEKMADTAQGFSGTKTFSF